MSTECDFKNRLKRLSEISRFAFMRKAGNEPRQPFKPCEGGHNDGPDCGLPLGGIGTGTFSRNTRGEFTRWHLRNGYHCQQHIDSARFALRWEHPDKSGYCNLGRGNLPQPTPSDSAVYHALFPKAFEYYKHEDWPFELLLESYSPVLPHNYQSSSLPVAIFDFFVRNRTEKPLKLGVSFFWPNLLGWRPEIPVSTRNQAWPEFSNHTGNFNVAIDSLKGCDRKSLQGILFQRDGCVPVRQDMEGQMLLLATGSAEAQFSRQVTCSLIPGNADWHINGVEEYFFKHGVLPNRVESWQAQWNEPLAGAQGISQSIAPGAEISFSFILVWDLPLVRFGSGRLWEKAYCRYYGAEGNNAGAIARDVLCQKRVWSREIDDWQDSILGKLTANSKEWQLDMKVAGALLNELYFLLDGGTVWTYRQSEFSTPQSAAIPRLGAGEHFAILEGYDCGYYFYNTLDIWPHAFLPLSYFWPHLADLVNEDFLRSVTEEIPERRLVYKKNKFCRQLLKGKLPHDVGFPPGDPWHAINSYTFALDSNDWKDHNPQFIVSLYLHKKLTAEKLELREWDSIKKCVEWMLKQDIDGDGLPDHNTFGDSTYDAFELKGAAAFSGGFTLAAFACLVRWAREVDDSKSLAEYQSHFKKAQQTFEEKLWNGEFYKLDTRGRYGDCIMADALLGVFLARRAGLGDLLPFLHIQSHLQAVYTYNYAKIERGVWGPFLVANKGGLATSRAVQLSEVLVGSAWACAAMMYEYGLKSEGAIVARSLYRVIYEKSGLQFRTPAAWNRAGIFRAALNLRPLAVWMLAPSHKIKE